MTDHNPDHTVLQSFVDGILRTMGTRASDDGFYGWHLVELKPFLDGVYMTFETPLVLRGWTDEGKTPLRGPHQVEVRVRIKR